MGMEHGKEYFCVRWFAFYLHVFVVVGIYRFVAMYSARLLIVTKGHLLGIIQKIYYYLE